MKKGKIINIFNATLFLVVLISLAIFAITNIVKNDINKAAADLGGSIPLILLLLSIPIIFLIWEGIVLFSSIKSFKHCNLENKYFYTAFVLNLLVVIITPLVLFLFRTARGISIPVFTLLIASIIYFVGYKKNKI